MSENSRHPQQIAEIDEEKVAGTKRGDKLDRRRGTVVVGSAKRAADDELIYRVLNRAKGQTEIFNDVADYEAFERILNQAVARTGTDVLAFYLMPNHWNLVVKPYEDGELSRFVYLQIA